MIQVWTDGSVTHNGWKNSYGANAYVVIKDEQIVQEAGEYKQDTTNNKMEMMAIINSLEHISDNYPQEEIIIYSDSQYCINGINSWIHKWKKNDWKKGQVSNIDLWKRMDSLRKGLDVKFKWVKGHADSEWNEYVDQLCTQTVVDNTDETFRKEMKRLAKKEKESFNKLYNL